MNEPLPIPATCPACGGRLVAGSNGALCPACMLQAAIAGDPGAESLSPQDSRGEQPGVRIGHYRLLEKIGEGGFGVVWMAEQEEPVRRRVALKIIKPGMDSREVVARFEAERQALAMMDHPNIASVFDGGTTATGLPYFVMELVEGVPITRYCDTNQMATRERLELFMDVCHAVQHAHQKGIIHRDLKPSNILVTVKDGRSVPKVIDFGIAKATQANLSERTHFTRLNQWLGTPEYMSPEQAGLGGLDVDTRSDIYSLGVLFYELLAGHPPFDPATLRDAGYDAILRVIREEEPPTPSTRLGALTKNELGHVAEKRGMDAAKLHRQLRGDLDWIVMKALEKDRSRRYESANALADDIRRHLENEVVLARPPGTAYRLKKAWRRHKVGFAAAGMVTAALVLGAALSIWQALRATRAEALATQRLADAEAISSFLTSAFQSPDPARDGRTITVAEMLDTAAKRLDTDLADQPARRASLQATIGKTYYALGLCRETIPLYEKVLDFHRAVGGPENPETLGAMNNLANSYFAAGRRENALKLQEEVLPLSRKVSGPNHPFTLMAMANLARSYFTVGRREEALKLGEDVLPLMREVNGPKHPDTLAAITHLAASYSVAGRLEEALKLREEVLPLSREVNGAEHPHTLMAMNNLAISYHAAGRRDEALRLQEEVLSLCRKVNGPEHPDALLAMNNLATSYSAAGRQNEALKLQKEVLPISRKVNGLEHPDTLMAMANLATFYNSAGQANEAIKLQEKLLPLRCKALGPEHPDTLNIMNNLANSYFAAGRHDEALKLREEVLPLRRKVLGPEHPETLNIMNNLANSYFAAGRHDEALKLKEEAVSIRRKAFGTKHPDTLTAMHNLAISHYEVGRREEALKMQEEVLPIRSKVLGVEHPDTLMAMNNLAASYAAAGRLDEALKLLEAVLPLRRKVLGPEHPDTLMAMANLAQLHLKVGRIQKSAGTLSEHAEFLRRAGFDQDSELQTKIHQQLVKLAAQQCEGPVEEDAIERYYAGNKESFRETSVHLFTITFQLETTDEARAKQRKEVEALRDEIANGKPFAEVAQERSEDPYASDGGDNLTVKRRDRTEPLNSAIFALKPGVPTIHDDGSLIRILKAEDRLEGDVTPLEDVREDIAGMLLQQQRDELLLKWQEEARVRVDAWEKEHNRADGATDGKENRETQGAN